MPIDEQTVQDQIDALQTQQPITLPTMARGSPADGTRPGWLGLLGEALGGGQGSGYRLRGREEDAAGSRALLNFGINMLLASGPSRTRPDLLSAAATGLQGAQQSIGADQQQAQARAAADYKEKLDAAKFSIAQDHSKIEGIKAKLPLLQLQQQIHQLNQPLPPALGGPPTGGPQAATGTPFVASNLPPGVSAAEDQLVRTVIGEAGGEPVAGQHAVAAVVKNRMAGGKSAQDVIFAPGQFEPWNNPAVRAKLEAIDPKSPQYQQVLNNVVRPVMAGAVKDPTGGATHFYSPTAQAALKRDTPAWAAGQPKAVIGGHRFYSPDGTPAAAPTAATPRQPLPPPTADVAPTGVQVSGPAGVATPGPAAPPSPAVAGNVGAIIAGMTGAGADATTLAPGAGGAPPGVAVAQAGPPAAAQPPVALSPAEEFDAYRKQNLRGGPDLTELERAKAIAQWQVRQAGTVAERAKAAADVAAADVAIGQRKAAWEKEETERLFKVWDADRTAARTLREKIDDENRKHEQTLGLERLRSENKQKEDVNSAGVRISEKRLEDLQGRASVAQRMIRNTAVLEALAPEMGDPNALVASNPKLRDWLISLNMPGLAGGTMGELRASQVWDRLVTSFAGDVRVPSSGSTSDKEGEWMMSQFGGPEQTIEDRMSQLSIIRKLSEHRIADHKDGEKLFIDQNGKLTGLDDKIAQRSKLFDRPPAWKPEDPEANIKTQGRYMMRHPRGEPYAAYTANGELRYYRNEMVKDPTTGKSRLEPRPLLGGSMVAE